MRTKECPCSADLGVYLCDVDDCWGGGAAGDSSGGCNTWDGHSHPLTRTVRPSVLVRTDLARGAQSRSTQSFGHLEMDLECVACHHDTRPRVPGVLQVGGVAVGRVSNYETPQALGSWRVYHARP